MGAPVELAEGTKVCTKCGLEKSRNEFYRRSGALDGLRSHCKACVSAWGKENTEARRQSWRRYRRKKYLSDAYGLTEERYLEMLEAQDGLCAICGKPGRSRGLHVDHDHSTGAVRGLLCHPCNSGMGMFGDDPEVLASAIKYLRA